MYTRKANPNATNSELDAKVIITPDDFQYEYQKKQYHLACHMEDDYETINR